MKNSKNCDNSLLKSESKGTVRNADNAIININENVDEVDVEAGVASSSEKVPLRIMYMERRADGLNALESDSRMSEVPSNNEGKECSTSRTKIRGRRRRHNGKRLKEKNVNGSENIDDSSSSVDSSNSKMLSILEENEVLKLELIKIKKELNLWKSKYTCTQEDNAQDDIGNDDFTESSTSSSSPSQSQRKSCSVELTSNVRKNNNINQSEITNNNNSNGILWSSINRFGFNFATKQQSPARRRNHDDNIHTDDKSKISTDSFDTESYNTAGSPVIHHHHHNDDDVETQVVSQELQYPSLHHRHVNHIKNNNKNETPIKQKQNYSKKILSVSLPASLVMGTSLSYDDKEHYAGNEVAINDSFSSGEGEETARLLKNATVPSPAVLLGHSDRIQTIPHPPSTITTTTTKSKNTKKKISKDEEYNKNISKNKIHHNSKKHSIDEDDDDDDTEALIKKRGGETDSDKHDGHHIEDPAVTMTFWQSLQTRSRWLVGLLVLQSMSSFILKNHDPLLHRHAVIVQFLTMLVGAGGNAGNQASVRVIRGLATGSINHANVKSYLKTEFHTGLLLSTILGIAGCIRAALFLTPPREIFAITSSLISIVIISVVIGNLLPLLMYKVGVDPAHSSTTIQVIMDILGVLITVSVSSAILH